MDTTVQWETAASGPITVELPSSDDVIAAFLDLQFRLRMICYQLLLLACTSGMKSVRFLGQWYLASMLSVKYFFELLLRCQPFLSIILPFRIS